MLQKIKNFLQISSQFDHVADRFVKRIEGEPHPRQMMHFCFDTLDQKTVALTCPREEQSKLNPIPKCCPKGQVIFENECKKAEDSDPEWTVSLDGYLYNASDLMKKGKLKFDESKSEIFKRSKCTDETLEHYQLYTFHLGQDGKLHSTDSIPNLEALENFCIDLERKNEGETYIYDEAEYVHYDVDGYEDGYEMVNETGKFKLIVKISQS